MELGDMVIARTADGEQEGRIVGRSVAATRLYDVRTETGILINVPANHVQPAASTCKSTPPAAPQTTNVSQPSREISYATAQEPKQVA
jgi:hypothetical protein